MPKMSSLAHTKAKQGDNLMPSIISIDKKIKRLEKLSAVLTDKPLGVPEITGRYNAEYHTKLSPKVIKFNILELIALSGEGLVKNNSKIRVHLTGGVYLFWKEEKK